MKIFLLTLLVGVVFGTIDILPMQKILLRFHRTCFRETRFRKTKFTESCFPES